jgi:hypothetical protein
MRVSMAVGVVVLFASSAHAGPRFRRACRVRHGARAGLAPRGARGSGRLLATRFDIESFQDPGASSVRVLGGLRVPIG